MFRSGTSVRSQTRTLEGIAKVKEGIIWPWTYEGVVVAAHHNESVAGIRE